MNYAQLQSLDPSDYNVLFLVMDSCRYDTAEAAKIPFMRSIGVLRRAISHADYTLPAHMAMFEGRLPSVEDAPHFPFYTDSVRQIWRVSPDGFFETKSKEEIGMTLTGDNIVEGYRRIGYHTVGAASLNHFAKGRHLNKIFDVFHDYYDVREGLIDPRPSHSFPLLHAQEISASLKPYEKWFLFINTKETHYPYDIGSGYSESLLPLLNQMKCHLNLRHSAAKVSENDCRILHDLQKAALEIADTRLENLVASLPKNRPILTVICADHGESFGENYKGTQRFGHLHPSEEVLHVPLIIGEINKSHF